MLFSTSHGSAYNMPLNEFGKRSVRLSEIHIAAAIRHLMSAASDLRTVKEFEEIHREIRRTYDLLIQTQKEFDRIARSLIVPE
jgi:hypothetical protein